MALLGANMFNEAGLKLLLSPLCSNVVIRTACCSVGVALPVYSTFKAIEDKDQDEQQKWLVYWAAYGSFSLVEVFSDKLLSWFPVYYYAKFVFLVWLQLPSSNGARILYMRHLRPFLLRHKARLDHITGIIYGEMGKFVSSHEGEIQFAKTLLLKVYASAFQEGVQPTTSQASNAIEGPAEQVNNIDRIPKQKMKIDACFFLELSNLLNLTPFFMHA